MEILEPGDSSFKIHRITIPGGACGITECDPATRSDTAGAAQAFDAQLRRLQRNLGFLSQHQTEMFQCLHAMLKDFTERVEEALQAARIPIRPPGAVADQTAQPEEELRQSRAQEADIRRAYEELARRYADLEKHSQERAVPARDLSPRPEEDKAPASGGPVNPGWDGDVLAEIKSYALEAIESRPRVSREFVRGAFEGVELVYRMLRDESRAVSAESGPPTPGRE